MSTQNAIVRRGRGTKLHAGWTTSNATTCNGRNYRSHTTVVSVEHVTDDNACESCFANGRASALRWVQPTASASTDPIPVPDGDDNFKHSASIEGLANVWADLAADGSGAGTVYFTDGRDIAQIEINVKADGTVYFHSNDCGGSDWRKRVCDAVHRMQNDVLDAVAQGF